MNYLAHLYLSGENHGFIIGNFIADHVKGKKIFSFEEPVKRGILLHREIDRFTDSHPVFMRSRKRLAHGYGRFSGVITDMFYDHFLSANWEDFSNEPVLQFTERMYDIIKAKEDILPEKSRRILKYMSAANWLVSYGDLEGIGMALSGMAKRIPYPSHLEHAVQDLTRDYSLFREDFYAFFPEIEDFSAHERQKLMEIMPHL
ncbi:MAG: DUF479 domain-containing protein [Bacteroidales bacterium]|nr:DUF479 domain-containing protein [Bacteroidales bacterium]